MSNRKKKKKEKRAKEQEEKEERGRFKKGDQVVHRKEGWSGIVQEVVVNHPSGIIAAYGIEKDEIPGSYFVAQPASLEAA